MGDFGAGGERVSMDMDTPDGKIDIEESTRVEDESAGDAGGEEGGGVGGGGGGEGAGGNEGRCGDSKESAGTEGAVDDDENGLYSSIEIGQIAGKRQTLFNFHKSNCRFVLCVLSSIF